MGVLTLAGVRGSAVVEPLHTVLAGPAPGVVHALQTLSGGVVTVAQGVQVRVPVALAGPTRLRKAALSLGVPKQPVIALLAAGACDGHRETISVTRWWRCGAVCSRLRSCCLLLTSGAWGAVTDHIQGPGGNQAGLALGTRAAQTGARLPGVVVETSGTGWACLIG